MEQSTTLQERKAPSCSKEVLSNVLERHATPERRPLDAAVAAWLLISGAVYCAPKPTSHAAPTAEAAGCNGAPPERPSRYQLKYHHH